VYPLREIPKYNIVIWNLYPRSSKDALKRFENALIHLAANFFLNLGIALFEVRMAEHLLIYRFKLLRNRLMGFGNVIYSHIHQRKHLSLLKEVLAFQQQLAEIPLPLGGHIDHKVVEVDISI